MSAPILAFDEIDSTNAEARRRAEAGEGGPLWITALTQTAGRGRRGRDWESPIGNLAATYLCTTDKSAADAAQVSFVAALAVAELADACVGAERVALKWPNDPLVMGLKASGILVESGAFAAGGLWLAVGIGVNLAHSPVAAERPATSFAEHMQAAPPKPREALDLLAAAFDRWLTRWQAEGFAPIAAAWTARAHGLGEPCVARLPGEEVHGVAEGLDPDGALRLRLDDGQIRRITAGDVFFGAA
ncbi:MAG: biotin--[acetyl-CoA-carboxylase] ligase [Caulobacteraceae bacterium]|nr:biotin--[acetyl-CoA-carboxylase] ligase [Caulobacteraceae bacterium]